MACSNSSSRFTRYVLSVAPRVSPSLFFSLALQGTSGAGRGEAREHAFCAGGLPRSSEKVACLRR